MSSAMRISLTLRRLVCWVASWTSLGVVALSRSAIRTYCMVIVEAPWETPPDRALDTKARATPFGSTPWCW